MLSLTLALVLAQEPTLPEAAPLDPVESIRAALEDRGLGGAIAVVRGEGDPEVWTFGHDVPGGRPITAADRFCAGSVGKTYFAALALSHVAADRLDLDAKVIDLCPDERIAALPNGEALTVRQLLRHQTGLGRYIETPRFWTDLAKNPTREWKTGDQLEYTPENAVHAPGEGWAYSDTNYVVLAMVLEKLEDRSVYTSIEERLLKPNGLKHTIPQNTRQLAGLVQGHSKTFVSMGLPELSLNEDGEMHVHPSFESGGGGYVSTPADLARWARLLWSGQAFEGDYLPAMLETVPAPMLRGEYGLGVIRRETEAGELLGHDGIFIGYLTAMGYFPEHDLAVAIQVNTDSMRAAGRPLHQVLVEVAGSLTGE